MSKNKYKAYQKEVERELKELTQRKSTRGDGGLRMGLKVPLVRKRLKEGYSFSGHRDSELLNIWNFIWKNSPYFEVKSQALYYFQRKKPVNESEFKKLKSWIQGIDCWEHSDDLSKIYAEAVEHSPHLMIPHIKKWNKSKNPWMRRQSVVALIEYSSKRKKVLPFQTLIEYVDALLADDEYYVQKGIGWTLREIFNVYPKKTTQYLEKNLARIDSRAYSAATEKMDKKLKLKWKNERKRLRQALND